MAELVLLLGVAHVPGQTSLADLPAAPVREAVAKVWSDLAQRVEAARPDLIIAISNDHFQNFIDVVPPFCVGAGETHRLPDDPFAKRLKLTPIDWPGAPDAADRLLQVANREGLPLAFATRLSFVDEFALPLHFMKVDTSCGLLPILTNCLHRHRPDARAFIRLGEVIAKAVAEMPTGRVAILVTGGLSHDPWGPDWGSIDRAFDKRFLELLVRGDRQALLDEITPERIDAAGIGGTPEVLNWFCAVGAAPAGVRPRLLAYVEALEWSAGIGYAEWPLHETHLPADRGA